MGVFDELAAHMAQGGAAPQAQPQGGGTPPATYIPGSQGITIRPWNAGPDQPQDKALPNPNLQPIGLQSTAPGQQVGPGTANPNDPPITDPSAPLEAAVGGATESVLQMKDTAQDLLGNGPGPKSDARKEVEGNIAALDKDPVNALAEGIAQFGTTMVGLGKFLKPLAVATGVIKDGVALNTVMGGIAGGAGFDPHEHALESLVQQFPALQGPIAQYLAAKPDETSAEGRLRNGIENIVTGAVLGKVAESAAGGVAAGLKTVAPAVNPKAYVRALTGMVRAIKLRRLGNISEANTAMDAAQTALKRAEPKGAASDANNLGSGGGMSGGAPGGTAPMGDGVLGDASPGEAGGGPIAGGQAREGVAAGGRQDGRVLQEEAAGGGPVQSGEDSASAGPTLERVPPGEQVKPRPKVQAVPELTPEQVQDLIDKAQKDTGAILDAGSYDAAQADGHAFAETDLIPWQKFETGNERVDAWMARVVDQQADYINKARGGQDGVMSDKQVNMMVGRLGAVMGTDPALLRGMILQAGKDAKTMVAKMETAFVLSQKAFQDAYGMAMRINAGNTGGLPLDAAVMQAKQRMATAVEMFGAAKAMLASGGRMVRRAQGQFSTVQMAALQAMRANLDKMGTADFLDLVSSTQGNPKALADKVVPSAWAQAVSWSTMVAAASKVWGWSTAVAIAVGNVSQLYMRPMASMLGAHYKLGQALIEGDDALRSSAAAMRTQARKELMVTTSLLNDGWQAAKWAFIRGQSRLAPHTVIGGANSELQAGGVANSRMGMGDLTAADYRPIQSVEDIIHNVLEATRVIANDPAESLATAAAMPFRLHGAMQEATQTMRYRAVVIAKADAEALSMGLKGKDYQTHIEGRARDAFDDTGQALDLDALQEARDTTFSSKLLGRGTDQTWGGITSTGAAVQHFAQDYQYARFFAPFIQFPANAFRRGMQLTPGLNLLQKQYLNDLTGVNGPYAQARSTGEMGLGLLFGMKAVQMRLDGQMTGGAAASPKEAQSRRQQGIMPYSLVFKDKAGQEHYFQLNRLEPYQAPFTWWADFADLMMAGHAADWHPPEDPNSFSADPIMNVLSAAMLGTMNLVKDKTSLTNISQFMDAMQNASEGENWAARFAAGTVVPFSSLMREVNPDPVLREVRGGGISGFIDGVKSQVPGASTTLPVRRDFLGKPIKVPGKFLNDGVLPQDLKDALEENYVATGHYPTPPDPRKNGIDLRDLTTSDGKMAYEEYKRYLDETPKGMPNLERQLTHLVGTDAYKVLTHGKASEEGTKENAIEHLLTAYHEMAFGRLMEDKTIRVTFGQRQKDIVHSNQANAKDLRAVKAKAAAESINKLLGPFGMSVPTPSDNVPPSGPQQ